MAVADELEVPHPYHPVGLSLSGGIFTANDWDVLTLILAFTGGWASVFVLTLIIIKKVNPDLKGSDRALVLWFVLSKSD
jgi:cholestenol delta-isomerase